MFGKENNDVYILQPFLIYNDRPIYVGYSLGKYVYYYVPSPTNADDMHVAGWCVSPHLGSGAPKFRALPPFCVRAGWEMVSRVAVHSSSAAGPNFRSLVSLTRFTARSASAHCTFWRSLSVAPPIRMALAPTGPVSTDLQCIL